MNTVYQIKEYGSFITGREVDGYITLPQHTFDQLENFILSNRNKDTDALELMGISARRGIGKVITAKNYVGIIAMNDGTTIEIMPKIFSEIDDESGTRTKRLLIDMLKTLRDSPYKNLQTANVNIDKMNILEIFIRMFIDEVYQIAKRGLKCDYEAVDENATFFKGKIKFSEQIKYNYVHKERSYIEYDNYNANRPENRLLKATLQYLYKHTVSLKNKNDIRTLLVSFSDVDASTDYKGDFAKYVPDRNMKDYNTALLWSRVFLMGKSFTSFHGSEVAMALLFPMETLFESYIAALLKQKLNSSEYTISVQDKTHYLFDEPSKRFLMRPDIVIKRRSDGATYILDTKWKLLSANKANYGISQADMYQMYAYQKKYEAENVILLYPQTGELQPTENIVFSSDDVCINVCFVDLFDVGESFRKIARDIHFEGFG